MSQQQKRKGFNFVKTAESGPTDNVAFDNLDKEVKSPVKKTNTKRKSDADVKPAKGEKKSKTAPAVKTKARYPVISYDVDSLVNANLSNKSIADKYKHLCKTLSSICKAETEGLETFFASTNGGSSNICSSLVEVLNQLPSSATSNVATDKFSPELSSEEKNVLNALKRERDLLQDFFNKLVKLDESPQMLNSEYNVGIPTTSSGSLANKAQSDNQRQQLENIVSEYGSLLHTLESRCDQIIGGTDNLNVRVDEARRAQETVYEVFNKARIETSSTATTRSGVTSTDPKDVMRQLSNLSK